MPRCILRLKHVRKLFICLTQWAALLIRIAPRLSPLVRRGFSNFYAILYVARIWLSTSVSVQAATPNDLSRFSSSHCHFSFIFVLIRTLAESQKTPVSLFTAQVCPPRFHVSNILTNYIPSPTDPNRTTLAASLAEFLNFLVSIKPGD